MSNDSKNDKKMDFFNGSKKKGKKSNKPPAQKLWGNILSTLLIFLLIIAIYSLIQENKEDIEDVSLSQVASDVKEGSIQKIVVSEETLELTYTDGKEKKSKKEIESALSETLTYYGVSFEELSSIEVEVKDPRGVGFWVLSIAPFLIPILFILIFFWFISRQVKGAGMQAFSFGQSKARIIDPNDKTQRVTFKDVAGVKEAKEELIEIVDFLKNPKKFLDIGARIPKGVLLMGPAGTGKTLLARAVAGEAKVPFFIISGSEFVEMFVGVGASRVRDLFKMAKKAAPAIIFVDEIDAVGRVRGSGVGGGNDEREQTLNQILVEMDGFEPNEKVIVMAATNRPDVLDPALLRPGRFDRRVMLDLPDLSGREEIIKIHAVGKPLEEDVDFNVIAQRTPGFSGADLYSLVNESAIIAAREDRKKVAQIDLIRSIEKVLLGPERKSHLLSKQEKEITAYHEAGHALVASVLPYADPVHKVSVVSRGNAGGYTLKLPLEERRLQAKREFLDDIAVSLGGYIAEELVFGDITTGPANDLQVASALARDMVTKYGMSEEFGALTLEEMVGKLSYGRGKTERDYSEVASAKVDSAVSRIIEESYGRAKEAITTHRNVLDAIAKKLVSVETLERKEFEELLQVNGITPKKLEEEIKKEVDGEKADSDLQESTRADV
jgi:cell division protease FtsH